MFYINSTVKKNEIYHKFIDIDGTRTVQLENYGPKLYHYHADGTFRSMKEGLPLKEHEFDSIRDYKDYLRDFAGIDNISYYGDMHPAYQFISDTYPGNIEFDASRLRILYLDIETQMIPGMTIHDAVKSGTVPILSISYYDSLEDQYVALYYKEDIPQSTRPDVNHIKCACESSMLEFFMDMWKGNLYPDVIVHWNGYTFDIPFLYNRITELFDEKTARELSPTKSVWKREDEDKYGNKVCKVSLHGINDVDFLIFYQKFILELRPNHKLDTIGKIELGEGKISFDNVNLMGLYERDFEKFIKYNIRDVEIMRQLDLKKQFIPLFCTLAYMAKINIQDVVSPVKTWDVLIYNLCREQGLIVDKKRGAAEKESFMGGYVKDPVPGLYDWIVSFDVNSMYPHIIRACNMGVETLIDQPHQHYPVMNKDFSPMLNSSQKPIFDVKSPNARNIITNSNGFYDTNEPQVTHAQSCNGFLFKKGKESVVSAIIGHIYESRIVERKKLAVVNSEIKLIEAEIARRKQ